MSTKIPAPPATFDADSIMAWSLAAEKAIRPWCGTARFNVYLDLVELADTFMRRAGSLERCEVSFLCAVRSVANLCANGAAVGTHPGVRGLAAAWSEQSWSFLVSECKANGWPEPTRLAGTPPNLMHLEILMQSANPFDMSLPVAIALLAAAGNDLAHGIAEHAAKYDLTGSMQLPNAIGHWIAFGTIERETSGKVYENADSIRARAAEKIALHPGDAGALRGLWHTLTGEDLGRGEAGSADFQSWASECEREARDWSRAYWRSGAELVTGAEAQGAQAAHDYAAGDGVTTNDLQAVRGLSRWEQEARSAAIRACDEDEEGRAWQRAYQAAWLRAFERTCNDIAEDFLAHL